MKKLIMMAILSGIVLDSYGCPPGTITPEEYLRDSHSEYYHDQYNSGRAGCTCLSGCIANGISYADVEYIKGSLEYADPTERLTAEEAHDFVERAKQLGNSEITKLIEQAPIIGPTGISYEQYLQMEEKKATAPEQHQATDQKGRK